MQSMFLQYGPGMNSFFALIRKLLMTFLVLAMIAVIQMSILYAYNKDNNNQGLFAKLTLGGFPYSRPICMSYPGAVMSMTIGCDGNDTIQQIFDYGFRPNVKDGDDESTKYEGLCLGKDFRREEPQNVNEGTDETYICDIELR